MEDKVQAIKIRDRAVAMGIAGAGSTTQQSITKLATQAVEQWWLWDLRVLQQAKLCFGCDVLHCCEQQCRGWWRQRGSGGAIKKRKVVVGDSSGGKKSGKKS